MAEICYGLVSQKQSTPPCETSTSRAARRRRMDLRRVKFVTEVPLQETTTNNAVDKRQKLEQLYTASSVSRELDNAVENRSHSDEEQNARTTETMEIAVSNQSHGFVDHKVFIKYGFSSVCGRRRDMEDAVAIHPFFCTREGQTTTGLHFFGVYDGHGCSHVAMKCRDRLHEVVKEEVEKKVECRDWNKAMERSFEQMDKEVVALDEGVLGAHCRCELQTPQCDAVGSTAVVAIVTSDKIIVANCGDSRAVLCRNGKPVPLSEDHKPDRPDELSRIQAAGGGVIYWDGPRVLGVLAMSRAIGDNYLKPYVSCEPEVTITDRTAEDDCLILASDGLWDVVSNDTACGVARMCLKRKAPAATMSCYTADHDVGAKNADKACSDASMLLTKLALARRTTDNVSVVVIDLRKNT